MKKNSLFLFFAVLATLWLSTCDGEKHTYVTISTEYGDMKAMLYNTTPVHRDSFVSLVEQGFYDGLLFHRVIQGFMIQGGDPDSRNASPGQRLGMGGPGYRIPEEIGSPHFRGVLAMARDNNPQKASSGSQFYIVQGRPVDDAMLDQMERQKGIVYSDAQRQLYKEVGGTPQLDNDYTVFGEIVEGMEVVDKITAVQTDPFNRPLEDIRMTIKIAE